MMLRRNKVESRNEQREQRYWTAWSLCHRSNYGLKQGYLLFSDQQAHDVIRTIQLAEEIPQDIL